MTISPDVSPRIEVRSGWWSSVAAAFDPRDNVLNGLRLVLAALVVIRHAPVSLTGTDIAGRGFEQCFGELPVDGFFALSGFLIARAWLNHPSPRDYLKARLGRLLPGYWACLAVTGLVFAPLSAAATGGASWVKLVGLDWIEYLVVNAGLVVVLHDVGGTPHHVPSAGDWNVSLWSLKYEMACYLGVLLLGVVGLVGRWWFVGSAAGLLWLGEIALRESGTFVGDTAFQAMRLGLMYLLGVLIWLLRDRIPVTWWSGPAALAVAVASAVEVTDFLPMAAPFLAYGLIATGISFHHRQLRLRNDVSYGMYVYGFPVEQLLAHASVLRGLGTSGFAVLAIVATLPVACASWFLVEKPALGWARGHRRTRPASAGSGDRAG